jgi:hypothetical protein
VGKLSTDDAANATRDVRNFLTVEEAAAVLRIGRTAAYEATRRYRATDGAEGIPVYKVGGTLRVPRHKLEEIAGGPIEIPTDHARTPSTQTPRSTDERPVPASTPTRRRINGDASAQQTLRLIP